MEKSIDLKSDILQDMTLEEGVALAKSCVAELRQRFLISQNVFIVKIITKDGIESIKL